MALQLIEIFIPSKDEYRVKNILQDLKVLDIWQERFTKDLIHIKILLPIEDTQEVLDLLKKQMSRVETYRIMLIQVEACIPRPEPPEREVPGEEVQSNEHKHNPNSKTARISREELYSDIDSTIKLSKIFILLALLSSVVAAVGILQDNVAVIIGAMVKKLKKAISSISCLLFSLCFVALLLQGNMLGMVSALMLVIAAIMIFVAPADQFHNVTAVKVTE